MIRHGYGTRGSGMGDGYRTSPATEIRTRKAKIRQSHGARARATFAPHSTPTLMTITLAGSLGHIGRPLTETLLAHGHAVRVISSNPDRAAAIESLSRPL